MPEAVRTGHRLIDDMALAYVTYDSPISDTPALERGLNVLTSRRRVIERRPGFSGQLEPTLTTFPGRIANLYTWRRWNGSFIVMLSHIYNGNSEVWKFEVDKDPHFWILYTRPGSTTPFDFIARNNFCFMGNATEGSMLKYNGTSLTKWGIAGPANKPVTNLTTATPGIKCEVDYHYRYTYWNANTGGESSPSEINDCLGLFSGKGVNVSVLASGDTQVTHIRIYRTRDGGSVDPRQMQELPNSPIANVSATITDTTEDGDLRNRFAPGLNRNDPPPALKGFKSHGSRIFGFVGNQVWWSGFDEITNGMQEECFPGGLAGNYWPWDDEITALGEAGGDAGGIAVFQPSMIYMIDGELRNEMRRYKIENNRGARRVKAVASDGSDIAWFDVSGQVRASSAGEISTDIRPDLKAIDQNWVEVTPHVAGDYNWLVVLNGISGTLHVFDLDIVRWQVPWPISATTIYSGEIAVGKRVLLAAIGSEVWFMQESSYNDRGQPYAMELNTSLIPLAPPDNPDNIQAVDSISIERNIAEITDILIATDDLATLNTTYVKITPYENEPSKRRQGRAIIEKRYTVPSDMTAARRMSIKLVWPTRDERVELYSINAEIHAAGN